MKSLFSLFIVIFFFGNAYSQTNQWGIRVNTSEAIDGYSLFKIRGQETYLINNCGEVVHTWESKGNLFTHRKLLPNGNSITISGSEICEYTWDGEELNCVLLGQLGIPDFFFDYEVIKLDNGNYLSAGRIAKSNVELDELGFNTLLSNPRRTDAVVEIDSATGGLVWFWDITDHMIQERDIDKANYGSVTDHPELLNVDAISKFDRNDEAFMINGMDYNPELDQIALSIRKMSEVVIIDHSTTTEEAQGSTGGNSGKGGDILYRWGNPQNYNQGTESDRFLFFQHNPKWILEGPHKDKLTCYNNGLSRPGIAYSQAPIINPPINANGEYELQEGTAFMPSTPELIYSGDNPTSRFYSPYTSGASVFANGNVFISEGENARLLEVNTNGEIVWEFKIQSFDYIFRAEKYNSDYPAFIGRDLSPIGIEIPGTNTNFACDLSTSTADLTIYQELFSLEQTGYRSYDLNNLKNTDIQFRLIDLQGKIWYTYELGSLLSQDITLDRLAPSIYILSAIDQKNGLIQSQKIVIQ